MNLFTAILDGAVAFVRRNPLFCLLILMLALFAPSVPVSYTQLTLPTTERV